MIVGIAMQQPTGAGTQPHLEFKNVDTEENGYTPDSEVVAPHPTAAAPPLMHTVNGEAAPILYTTAPLMGQHHHHHHPHHLGMIGLDQQFAQFGLHPSEHGSSHSGHDSSDNNDTENNEGEDSEEEPLKLFVGQVPKALNEEDIFPTFDGFGPLKDVAVIRDKHTGIHRGCAFVTYWSAVDAERARETLHDKFTFPGGKRPAQVKPAEPAGMFSGTVSRKHASHRPAASPENKLFIGMLSRKAEENDVRELFSRFGEIREIYMIRSADGSSKCAAFLRYVTRESAEHAIEQLHGIEVMEGSQRPLIVKFADTKQQRNQRLMRNMRRHEMMTMPGPAGYYPAHPSQGPPMAMQMHPGAAPHYPIPQPGAQAYPANPYGQAHHPYMYAPIYGQVPAYSYHPPPPQESRGSNPRPREGPQGANLFVYHLPHDLTDADLATAFNPFGNVVSAKVYVDKYTGESKGFGFVSYDSVPAASSAIEQMNGFQIGNKRLKVQHKRIHGSGVPREERSNPSSTG